MTQDDEKGMPIIALQAGHFKLAQFLDKILDKHRKNVKKTITILVCHWAFLHCLSHLHYALYCIGPPVYRYMVTHSHLLLCILGALHPLTVPVVDRRCFAEERTSRSEGQKGG